MAQWSKVFVFQSTHAQFLATTLQAHASSPSCRSVLSSSLQGQLHPCAHSTQPHAIDTHISLQLMMDKYGDF